MTRFEYSNLGYAILGRVITAVTGVAYPDYIRHRLLTPLGMTRTGFEAEEFEVPGQQAPASGGLARGYRRANGDRGWSEVAFDPAGAFAPMGGIFSCVRDLTRWVAGFAAAFPPGGPQDGGAHPLARATRREMQLPQVTMTPSALARLPGDPAEGGPAGYGFGLFVEEHPVRGRITSHSGGYPGFGSNMRWHPASGTGVIALGNSTYAAMMTLATQLLDAVLRHREPPASGVTGGQPRNSGTYSSAGSSSLSIPSSRSARTADAVKLLDIDAIRKTVSASGGGPPRCRSPSPAACTSSPSSTIP